MELPVMVMMFLLGLGMIWAMQGLTKTFIKFSRSRKSSRSQAHKHFIQGAQLLAASRLPRNKAAKGRAMAHKAVAEADQAIALDPNDAASHILKGLALEQLGNTSAALRSLSVALSPPVCLGLSPVEKADALVRRAGLQLATFKGKKGAKAALEDLQASKSLNFDNPKAQSLLDTCYQRLGMDKRSQGLEQAAATDPTH
ncbi:hypothetical protein O6H91_20G002000 [Diphasiastrum complanatum]|uniref:Uncharacterized protein n=1 Tax=Diphasiastrum complanatum TaxID=34168 RepID=A0ACC2AMD1_DIPCM|nr:hypothetical protein O6H91_20G002000 [Diphasiastrum complanatum]